MSAPLGNIGPPIRNHIQGFSPSITPQLPASGIAPTSHNGGPRFGQPPNKYSFGPGPAQMRPVTLGPPGSMNLSGTPGPGQPTSLSQSVRPIPPTNPVTHNVGMLPNPKQPIIGPPLSGAINQIGPQGSGFIRTPGSSVGPSPVPSPGPNFVVPPRPTHPQTPNLNGQSTQKIPNPSGNSLLQAQTVQSRPPLPFSTLSSTDSARPYGPPLNPSNGSSFSGPITNNNSLQRGSMSEQRMPVMPSWPQNVAQPTSQGTLFSSTGQPGPSSYMATGLQGKTQSTPTIGPPPIMPPQTQEHNLPSNAGPPSFSSEGLRPPPPLSTTGTLGSVGLSSSQNFVMSQPVGQQNSVLPPNGTSTSFMGPLQNGSSNVTGPLMHPPSFSRVAQPSTNSIPPPPTNSLSNNMPPPPMSNGILPQQNLFNQPPRLPPTSTPNLPPVTGSMLQPTRPSGMPPPMQQTNNINNINARLGNLSLQSGMEPVDLLQNRHILPPQHLPPPKPRLAADVWNQVNCSPEIFRSTLTKIPETEALLRKARLPLGILIHPFKDLSHLPVIQCTTIVRCRQCRTYINPFVQFVDQRRWRCNICYRVNELPEEFLYDPVSKSYGDPSRRPECKSSTIEFIAPSEYMLRPPQPAVYVFCLDASRQAVESGYLKVFCEVLLDELDKLPGDARTQIAFLTFDRGVHFYSMPEGSSRPTQLTVSDVDDIFLPSPSDLLVNLHDCRNLVIQLLEDLPSIFNETHETDSALGAALLAAFKLASSSGGRITVFQHILPKVGPGALQNRELSSDNKGSETSLLGPSTDFYKKLSLDCSGQQIAVDLFAMGSQYQDIASLSGMSKFSAGQIQYFPGYHVTLNPSMSAKFECALRRYLTRKIGFEAVMRIRCTRGLALHTFHGNFFVRSTDLLALPNINPDAGFGIQVTIEDDLRDSREVSFQAALLYTSSKGERRIRVHTLCVPTTANLNDVINGADERAIVGMLTKFAADRAVTDSIGDAKEGLVVSCVDTVETYRTQASMSIPNGLLISQSLKLLPLNVLACLRSVGLRPGMKLDERSYNFVQFKTLPLKLLLQNIYPDLYRVDNLTEEGALREEGGDSSDEDGATEILVPQPPRLQLSFERVSATGMYLMDVGDMFLLYLSRGLHAYVLEKCFGVTRLQDINESLVELPELENSESEKLRTFVHWLNGQKPYQAPIKIIREDGKFRHLFVERMIEDRMDNSFSYFEFLQHIKQQIK